MINVELLKDRISSENLTHEQVAKSLGISKNTFTKILKTRKCDTEQIDVLCEVLHIIDPNAKINIFLS